jgi:NAD(P)H-dependent FMN reductase
LDWLSRAGGKTFQDKPTLLMATSPGARGGGGILGHMLQILPYAGAQVTGGFSLPFFFENFKEGDIIGEHKTKLVEELAKLNAALNA